MTSSVREVGIEGSRKLILSFIFAPFVHLTPLSLMSFSNRSNFSYYPRKKVGNKQGFFPSHQTKFPPYKCKLSLTCCDDSMHSAPRYYAN